MVNNQCRAREIRTQIPKVCFFKKKWAIPSLFFLYFHLFNTVDSLQMFNKFCQRLDSNRGPLVLEATALPN